MTMAVQIKEQLEDRLGEIKRSGSSVLDRQFARAEEGSRVWLAEARTPGALAPAILAVGLTSALGLVSMKLLPRPWSGVLVIGALVMIGLRLDARRRARV